MQMQMQMFSSRQSKTSISCFQITSIHFNTFRVLFTSLCVIIISLSQSSGASHCRWKADFLPSQLCMSSKRLPKLEFQVRNLEEQVCRPIRLNRLSTLSETCTLHSLLVTWSCVCVTELVSAASTSRHTIMLLSCTNHCVLGCHQLVLAKTTLTTLTAEAFTLTDFPGKRNAPLILGPSLCLFPSSSTCLPSSNKLFDRNL